MPSTTIYRELVPFGTAYQNIVGDLSVSPEGALAYLSGGGNEADEDLLGSPFPLDAAMHAAVFGGSALPALSPSLWVFKKDSFIKRQKKAAAILAGLCRWILITSR